MAAANTIRKSSRLSTKANISYKEKKPPVLKKSRISKSVVHHKIIASTANSLDLNNTQLKEVVKAEMKAEEEEEKENKSMAETFDILKPPHLSNAIQHFKKHDPKIAMHLDTAAIETFKNRLSNADGSSPFKSLARTIIYQQIHGKAAAAIYNRLVQLFDTSMSVTDKEGSSFFPTPEQLLSKSNEDLRSAGLSARKVEYIQSLAQQFIDKGITPDKFNSMTDEEISIQLCKVKGIGQWSVDMFLMFDLHHPDVLPLGDLVVRRGVAKHFGLALPSDPKKIFPLPQHMTELTKNWRPYRTLASWMMWHLSSTVVVGDEDKVIKKKKKTKA